MIRFALLGSGSIGQVHGANIAANPRARLQYVYDENTAAANNLAGRCGAMVAGNVEEVFATADVDAVFIASSTNTHADLLSAAIRTCKPTYCEKLIDMDLARVKTVVQLAHDRPTPIMMGFIRRFVPTTVVCVKPGRTMTSASSRRFRCAPVPLRRRCRPANDARLRRRSALPAAARRSDRECGDRAVGEDCVDGFRANSSALLSVVVSI